MRKTVLSTVILLTCASSLEAQLVTQLGRTAAGTPEIRIRNKAGVSLAAFAVAMNPSPAADDRTQFVVFVDTLVDKIAPLEPEQERAVPVMLRSRPGRQIEELFEQPIISAGILADGKTTGNAVLLTRLMVRRCNMLLAVETALETLALAGRRNVPRDQLIDEFRRMAGSGWRWYVPPEQQVGRSLHLSMLDKLKQVPEGPPGSAFPPSAFVAEETARLNRERVALLESEPNLTTATLIRE